MSPKEFIIDARLKNLQRDQYAIFQFMLELVNGKVDKAMIIADEIVKRHKKAEEMREWKKRRKKKI